MGGKIRGRIVEGMHPLEENVATPWEICTSALICNGGLAVLGSPALVDESLQLSRNLLFPQLARAILRHHPRAADNFVRRPLASLERQTCMSDRLSLCNGRHHSLQEGSSARVVERGSQLRRIWLSSFKSLFR